MIRGIWDEKFAASGTGNQSRISSKTVFSALCACVDSVRSRTSISSFSHTLAAWSASSYWCKPDCYIALSCRLGGLPRCIPIISVFDLVEPKVTDRDQT